MQKRLLIVILVALLCILIFGGNAGANDNLQVEISYMIYPDADVDLNALNAMFTDVETGLSRFNIDLEFVSVEYAASTSARIHILPYGEANHIQLWMGFQNPSIEKLSPILFSSYLLIIELDLSQETIAEELIALILYQSDMIEESETTFLSYLPASDEELREEYFYLANIKILQGDYEAALKYLDQTDIRSSWQSVQFAVHQAWILFQQGNKDEAFRLLNMEYDISTTLDLEPSVRVILISHRAQLYALAFDYDSAIADMNAAIELAEENGLDNTTLAELYTIRGEIIFLIYEWDRVLDNFNHALEIDSNYAPAYFQRGVLYYTMALREDALADFEHYLELAPEGQYAEEAEDYIESIPIEIDSLGG